jgi:hypothetical protein
LGPDNRGLSRHVDSPVQLCRVIDAAIRHERDIRFTPTPERFQREWLESKPRDSPGVRPVIPRKSSPSRWTPPAVVVAALAVMAAPTQAAESESRIGPVEWSLPAGTVELGFAAQLRADVLSRDAGDRRSEKLSLSVGRLRTTLRGGFFEDRLQFEFQANTTPATFELVDVWMSFAFDPSLQIRVGQMIVPYTWYRQISFSALSLVDWAPTTAWFGSERQFGLLLHDEAADESPLSYRVGVFSGENRRASHAIRLRQYYGEPLRNRSAATEGRPTREVDPELVGTLRWSSPGFDGGAQTDFVGGPMRWSLAVSSALNFDADDTEDFVARSAVEGWLKVHHLSLLAIGYLGLSNETRGDDVIVAASGVNVEAAYRLGRAFEIAGRFALVIPTDALARDARTRARDIIDGAGSPEERDALVLQYENAGDTTREQEARLGLTYFVVGHSLKFQADAAWIQRELRGGTRNDVQARALLQLTF